MLDVQLLNDFDWKHSRSERSSEDRAELLVQTADAELLEVPVRIDQRLLLNLALRFAGQINESTFFLLENHGRVRREHTAADLLGRTVAGLRVDDQRVDLGAGAREQLLVGELEADVLSSGERVLGELHGELARHHVRVVRLRRRVALYVKVDLEHNLRDVLVVRVD